MLIDCLIVCVCVCVRGLADERSSGSAMSYFCVNGRTVQTLSRKLTLLDTITMSVDLTKGSFTMSVNGNEFQQVFDNVTCPSDAEVPTGNPQEFYFGATFGDFFLSN